MSLFFASCQLTGPIIMSKGQQSNSPQEQSAQEQFEQAEDITSLSPAEVESLIHALRARVKELTDQNERIQSELANTRRWLIQSYEQDFSTIARDLHGGPIQELSSLLFDLNILQDAVQDEASREIVTSLRENLKMAVRTLRRFIHDLRPASLAHFGLQTAIRTYVENFQTDHTGIKIAFFLSTEDRLQPPEVEHALYRILQHLLDNVIKHAQARNVLIRLHYQDDVARLEVEDDGIGFETEPDLITFVRQNRMGLFRAGEQAKMLAGAVTVESTPGKGALVRAMIPVRVEA
jgi:signal transduction histidine kinase